MEKILITTSFGLESLVKFQLRDMGYKDYEVSDGLISLKGDLSDLAKLNINLKHADRVYLEVASFKAMEFEELFENVNKISWQDILNEDVGIFISSHITETLKKLADYLLFADNGIITFHCPEQMDAFLADKLKRSHTHIRDLLSRNS